MRFHLRLLPKFMKDKLSTAELACAGKAIGHRLSRFWRTVVMSSIERSNLRRVADERESLRVFCTS